MQANAAAVSRPPVTPPTSTTVTSSGTGVTSTLASGVPGALLADPLSASRLARSRRDLAHATTRTVSVRPSKTLVKAKPKAKTIPKRATHPAAPAVTRAHKQRHVSRSSTRTSTTARATTVLRTTVAHKRSAVTTESSSSGPTSIRAGAPGSAAFGAAVLAIASRYAGIAYRYGGTTPAGFDCSGFTSYVLRQVGISLPRTSSSQRAATTRISRSEAVAGDLVFMPGHVGIYAGNGMMWDSPRTGDDVSKRPVYSGSTTYGRVG